MIRKYIFINFSQHQKDTKLIVEVLRAKQERNVEDMNSDWLFYIMYRKRGKTKGYMVNVKLKQLVCFYVETLNSPLNQTD